MLYEDLEYLKNSIVTTADYAGKIRFYMRAAAADEPYHDELLERTDSDAGLI